MRKDDVVSLGVWMVCMFIMVVPVIAIIWGGQALSCRAKANAMKMDYTYGPLQGCMIEHAPGKWIDIERYRVIE